MSRMPANPYCLTYARRAQQQGIVVAGYKSFVSEIHRISIQLVSRSVLKLDKGKNADYLVTINPEHQQAFPSSNILRIAYHIWIQPSRKELRSACFPFARFRILVFYKETFHFPPRNLRIEDFTDSKQSLRPFPFHKKAIRRIHLQIGFTNPPPLTSDLNSHTCLLYTMHNKTASHRKPFCCTFGFV